MRNARIIEEAFDTIKDATGITNIDEIVTTFIKAEEQNYSLFTYVDQLGQESDKLEEQNAYLDRMIEQYEQMEQLSDKDMAGKVVEMEQQAEGLREQILLGNEECN